MKNTKGSVSVEAAVVLPFFVTFILTAAILLNVLLVRADFEKSVAQAAARLAETAYSVTFLNQLTDDIVMGGGSPLITGGPAADIEGTSADSAGMLDFIGQLIPNAAGFLPRDVAEELALKYSALKSQIVSNTVFSMLDEYSDSKLSKSNAHIVFAQLPQSITEFSANNADAAYRAKCLQIGFFPEIDDVALYVEYEYKINLPFIGSKTFVFRKLCVERAWIRGANDLGDIIGLIETAVSPGSSDAAGSGETVYITRTGIRYHAGWCMYLYKSKFPVTLGEAADRGYTACKVCWR